MPNTFYNYAPSSSIGYEYSFLGTTKIDALAGENLHLFTLDSSRGTGKSGFYKGTTDLLKGNKLSTRGARIEIVYEEFYKNMATLMAMSQIKYPGGARVCGFEDMTAILDHIAKKASGYAPVMIDSKHDKKHMGQPHLYESIYYVISHWQNGYFGFVTVDPQVKYAAEQHERLDFDHHGLYSQPNPLTGQYGQAKYIERAVNESQELVADLAAGALADAFALANAKKITLSVDQITASVSKWYAREQAYLGGL
jgi:hypothetical protein